MVELAPSLAETLTEQTALLGWLLKRVGVRGRSACSCLCFVLALVRVRLLGACSASCSCARPLPFLPIFPCSFSSFCFRLLQVEPLTRRAPATATETGLRCQQALHIGADCRFDAGQRRQPVCLRAAAGRAGSACSLLARPSPFLTPLLGLKQE